MSKSVNKKVSHCKICFSVYDFDTRRSRVLPCGHTFCSSCIHDIIRSKSGYLTCPNCRSEHTLTSASELKPNYTVEEMYSVDNSPVVDSTSMASGGFTPKLNAGVCGEHGQYLLFHCDTCEVWICQACTVIDHPRDECAVVSIKKAIENLMTKARNEVNCQIDKCNKAVSQLSHYNQELEEQIQAHKNLLRNKERVIGKYGDLEEALQMEQLTASKRREEGCAMMQDLRTLKDRIAKAATLQEMNNCNTDASQFEGAASNWIKDFENSFPDQPLLSKAKKMNMMTSTALELMNWEFVTCLTDTQLQEIAQSTKKMLLCAYVKTSEVYASLRSKDKQRYVPLISKDNSFIFGNIQDHLPPSRAVLMSLEDLLAQTVPVYGVVEMKSCRFATTISSVGEGYWLDPVSPSQIAVTACKIPLLETLVKEGLVYAVMDENGHQGSAQLSHRDGQPANQFYLHAITNRPPPSNAFKIAYRHLRKIVGTSPICTFLDLAWGDEGQGQVCMQVDVTIGRGQQFLMLCTGERGSSYTNTNLLSVANKGQPGEFIIGGDYETNNGSGGAALLSGLIAVGGKSRQLTAGLVSGHSHSDKSSQFLIYTRDLPDSYDYLSFGQVKTGLDVLLSVAQLSDPRNVIVKDCGVIVTL
ncbi:hypothetical protein OTU49_012320 [Cherax quadricarinatus]|uniref:Uncharacterized protein n=1 Tax=Cherax quadricarinatus TaxID=27406 RepID=A0AAW0VXS8_CHEQU